jgi:hypothetical protein
MELSSLLVPYGNLPAEAAFCGDLAETVLKPQFFPFLEAWKHVQRIAVAWRHFPPE